MFASLRDACPCKPPFRVERIKEWRKVVGITGSVPFFFFFSFVCRGTEGGPFLAAKLHQHLGLGDSHSMSC